MPVSNRTLSQRVRQASRTRREAARSSVREALLRAAGELLLEAGYDAFSLRKVAERVGYTATTIYRHFADKDALLYAVTDEGFRLFAARLRGAGAGVPDPFDSLEAMGRAYIDFGLEHPVYYRVMFMERPDMLWRRSADRPGSRMESFGVLRAAVEAAVATGRTVEADVLAISNALWAQTHGAVALALSMPHMPARQARAFGTLGVGAIVRGLQRS
ncbi:MAG: TetR/AcrR family transcriptional regulator [Gemmatimonadales bacterium]